MRYAREKGCEWSEDCMNYVLKLEPFLFRWALDNGCPCNDESGVQTFSREETNKLENAMYIVERERMKGQEGLVKALRCLLKAASDGVW